MVAVGMVLSPIRATYGTIKGVVLPLVINPELLMPSSPLFQPRIAGFACFELVANLFQIGLLLRLAWSFFRKKRRVPKLFCAMAAYSVLLQLTDRWLFIYVFSGSPLPPHLTADLLQELLRSAIWVPYFLMSERVKNTFVR